MKTNSPSTSLLPAVSLLVLSLVIGLVVGGAVGFSFSDSPDEPAGYVLPADWEAGPAGRNEFTPVMEELAPVMVKFGNKTEPDRDDLVIADGAIDRAARLLATQEDFPAREVLLDAMASWQVLRNHEFGVGVMMALENGDDSQMAEIAERTRRVQTAGN